jgi:chromosome partitioning protein
MKILKKKISEVDDDYDYIFFDLPPSVSRIPKNAWVSSDYLLIPISDYFALN